MLTLKNISHSYNSYNFNNDVLSDINVDFSKSTINTIFGNSGTGKTTLLNISGLITKPNSGRIILNKKEINYSKNISDIRLKNFGFVFQNHYLFPEFTVKENLILPGVISGLRNSEIKKIVYDNLDRFNIRFIEDKYPSEISVGEAQRVSLIRSLVTKPKIIFADEPTSNLDNNNAEMICDLFKELKEENKYIIIIATHDKRFLKIANNNYELNNKKLIKL